MKVVVCSPSTKKYITDGDEYFIVTEPPKENILEKENMFNGDFDSGFFGYLNFWLWIE